MLLNPRISSSEEKNVGASGHGAQLDFEFEALIDAAKSCRSCARMDCSVRVIGHASGSLRSRIMFIGEAPGRLGADASAIPFHGDKAGHNFEGFLSRVGINRYDVFVTNAVLCNPKDDKGNNATPTEAELRNCSDFLRKQIEIVAPEVVVTLGGRALHALNHIEEHGIKLSEGVRNSYAWCGRTLIPLYHPGQRALIHRSFANQLADYQFVKEAVYSKRCKSGRANKTSAKPEVLDIVRELIRLSEGVTYFGVHKLMYLLEYEIYKATGERLTDAYFVRQKDGPYFTDLHIAKLKAGLPDLRIKTAGGKLNLSIATDLFDASHKSITFPRFVANVMNEVVVKYGKMSDEQIKTAVYMTQPMRSIMRQEKHFHRNWFNRPITFDELLGQR